MRVSLSLPAAQPGGAIIHRRLPGQHRCFPARENRPNYTSAVVGAAVVPRSLVRPVAGPAWLGRENGGDATVRGRAYVAPTCGTDGGRGRPRPAAVSVRTARTG